MVTLNVITPAKDRSGQICSSYHKDSKGNSLVKTGVSRTTETFENMAQAHKFMQKHPDNGYVIKVS